MLRFIWAIPLLPLAGFLATGLLGRRLSKRAVGVIACGAVLAAFLLSVGAVVALSGAGSTLAAGGGSSLRWDPEHRRAQVTVAAWIPAAGSGGLSVDWGFVLDPLSAVMILVVTGVGFLIHVYSIGYMHDDPGYARYFAYLNLFMAMMLTLVLGASYPVLFVGWEGVGLCSYLLIGFWYQDVAKATAGMKAFLVNRIGDFGFMLGMLLMFAHFGTLDIQTVAEHAGGAGAGAAVTLIALLLFVGATGKSAQVPLYVWLPDAMAGPTPVSALIHAATMVTAGVYMVARSSVVYVNAPAALATVAVVGAVTAFLAATIAIVQTDIKKVLAYSTVSQLGYMFLGCGVGAFSAGIFHLVTHAFFKALLFLGAGSVIHAMSGEQEMPRMGGLRAHLPSTYRTMLIGALALAGIPPLAGFFSKDEILGKAWEDGHLWLWLMGSVTALLTAFYVFRLIYLTFFGAPRMSAEARHHLHESPAVMTVPLWILAGLAAVGGVLGLPASLGFGNFLEGWLEPALAPAQAQAEGAAHAAAGGEAWLLGVAALIAVAGWGVARTLYQARPEAPARIAARAGALYRVLKGKYFVDEIYQMLFVRSCIGSAWALDRFDRHVVDGTVNGSGAGVEIAGQIVKLFHTGYVRNYALSFFLGVVFILWFMLVR